MALFRIYKVTNLINGKIYVGKESSPLYERWAHHKWLALNNKSDTVFHQAIREFGPENFKIEVLFETDCEDILKTTEATAIITEKAHVSLGGYNMTTGSQGGLRWTIQEVSDCAIKYATRTEWAKSVDSSSYWAATYHGWVDAVTKHMPAPEFWTKEEIITEAKKYQTMEDFKNGCRGAYDSANNVHDLYTQIKGMMKRTSISGVPIVVGGVFYINSLQAAKALSISPGNLSMVLKGYRKSVSGMTAHYADRVELVSNGLDPELYLNTIPIKRTNKLNSHPLIDQTGAIFDSKASYMRINGGKINKIPHILKNKGIHLRYATEAEVIAAGFDKNKWSCFK